MLKQNLQQKLGLKINPLQIQLIKLLEIPTIQLEQRIKEELEKNPLLEEGEEDNETNEVEEQDLEDDIPENDDEFSIEDYLPDDDDTPDYKLTASNTSKDDKSREYVVVNGETFRESLISQLGMLNVTTKDKAIAEYIIGNIDDDGYLRRDAENIADDISFSVGIVIEEDKILELLKLIQGLEPAGVGARDLQECLLLQIKRKLGTKTPKPIKDAYNIITKTFNQFTRKHYEKIAARLNLSNEELKLAVDEILKLNPKPGGSGMDVGIYSGADKIIPDFSLEMIDGELQLSLNTSIIPSLRINKSYLEMLESFQNTTNSSKEKKDVVSFVKYKYNSAKSFIDAISQRNNTLMLTMTAIVQFQKSFFMTGDDNKMKPMILKDIADITGLDISTISRVSNSKYVQTWFGVYAIKDFFTGSMPTVGGKDVSTGKLKNELIAIVDNEDKSSPYTDEQLVKIMKSKGYKIARRTVVKYRQILNIPVAVLRKEL